EPDLPRHAANNAAALAEGLRAAGLRVGIPDAAIVSVHAPGAEEAVSWAARCTSQGVGVSSDRPPVVPDGASRLRLAARSDLGEQDNRTAGITTTGRGPPGAPGGGSRKGHEPAEGRIAMCGMPSSSNGSPSRRNPSLW